MAEPFLAEIKIVSFGFAPKGWAMCNGQLLPINQNQALFSLLGTTHGGDGRVNFALPDLRGRVPIHVGGGFQLGERGGEASHTLSIQELPAHAHGVQSSTSGPTALTAAGNVWAAPPNNKLYAAPSNLVALNPAAIAPAGGSQPHLNEMPDLVLNFIIALQGIFPTQN
jgi:microcystin-dependent protein